LKGGDYHVAVGIRNYRARDTGYNP
jgi:hypothetical protein